MVLLAKGTHHLEVRTKGPQARDAVVLLDGESIANGLEGVQIILSAKQPNYAILQFVGTAITLSMDDMQAVPVYSCQVIKMLGVDDDGIPDGIVGKGPTPREAAIHALKFLAGEEVGQAAS